jgi:DNA-directed RNA polymerase specialized sigma24 family protein
MDFHGGLLAGFYQRYKAGIITVRDLETVVFEHMSGRYGNWYFPCFENRGKRVEFLCWAYPRIRRAIRRYDGTLSSFDAYLARTIRYSYRTYKNKQKKHAAVEFACWNAAGGTETDFRDTEAVYREEETPMVADSADLPKHVLLLLLKSYYHVSDRLIGKAARAFGMEPEVLSGMIDRLYSMHLEKITRRKKLVRAAHGQYFRCLSYETQLMDKHKSVQRLELLSRRLKRARARLASMRERLKSMRMEATNSRIAELLGIPKGTVDSRLAAIRCKLAMGKQL